jgi:hypothetical protein
MKVHPAMLMKTKEGQKRCQVAGARAAAHLTGFQGIGQQADHLCLASGQKMKVHPAMLMKIKEHEKMSQVQLVRV